MVAPGGHQEFAAPAEYHGTTQDDYSAADRPTNDDSLEWFAEEASNSDFELTHSTYPKQTLNPGRPRTYNAGYDPKTQRLRVEFREGAIYEYSGVTPEQWYALQQTSSVGKWMNRNLPMYQGVRVN